MRALLVAAAMALGVTACSGSGTPVAQLPTSRATTTPAGSPTTGPVEPVTHLLDWQPVDGAIAGTVTTNGEWTVTVDRAGSGARMDGAAHTLVIPAGPGRRISEVLLDDTYAVVVAQDKQEVRPSTATVVTLDSGEQFAERRQLPVTLNGGTWAMFDGQLVHATYGSGRRYCLEQVDLASLHGSLIHCAAPRHGFSEARMTPAGTTLLTFDSRPGGSCRTPSEIVGSAEPLPGVTHCHGWDSLLTADGQVWSVVPKENQVETARFFATAGDDTFELGVGTTGSLTWCGDSAYFVRDSQKDVDQARLLRWTPGHTLEVVYESPGAGNAFLSEPRCAGGFLTINAYGEGGDEQVSAHVD